MTVTVSSKGQIAIPADIRRSLGLTKGARMKVSVARGRVVFEKVPRQDWRSLRGLGKGSGALRYLEQEHRLEVERDEAPKRGS